MAVCAVLTVGQPVVAIAALQEPRDSAGTGRRPLRGGHRDSAVRRRRESRRALSLADPRGRLHAPHAPGAPRLPPPAAAHRPRHHRAPHATPPPPPAAPGASRPAAGGPASTPTWRCRRIAGISWSACAGTSCARRWRPNGWRRARAASCSISSAGRGAAGPRRCSWTR